MRRLQTITLAAAIIVGASVLLIVPLSRELLMDMPLSGEVRKYESSAEDIFADREQDSAVVREPADGAVATGQHPDPVGEPDVVSAEPRRDPEKKVGTEPPSRAQSDSQHYGEEQRDPEAAQRSRAAERQRQEREAQLAVERRREQEYSDLSEKVLLRAPIDQKDLAETFEQSAGAARPVEDGPLDATPPADSALVTESGNQWDMNSGQAESLAPMERGLKRGQVRNLAAAPSPAVEAISRYPTIDVPDEVEAGTDFAVTVSLTEELVSPQTTVAGDSGDKIKLSLPAEQDVWTLDVVLSAPGLAILGTNTAKIELPRAGDSTPALFRLRAPAPQAARLSATLWHDGVYLGRMTRPIRVGPAGGLGAPPASITKDEGFPGKRRAVAFDMNLRQPDLTLFVLHDNDPLQPGNHELIIASPWLQPTRHSFRVAEGMHAWLESHFARFASASARGLDLPSPKSSPDASVAMLRGFGTELYAKFAPQAFKEAYCGLRARLGPRFQSIQILTDDPELPWELMRPDCPDGSGEHGYLGVQMRIARWHLRGDTSQFDRPPQALAVKEVAVIAPHYKLDEDLPAQKNELETLQKVEGFRAVRGGFKALAALVRSPPEGIIHFAGHGTMTRSSQGIVQYALRLKSVEVDMDTWRGLLSVESQVEHPLVIFNACDLGRSDNVAGFVNGWAPTILESGASGYIGGLWPLGDRGAAEFSARFYGDLDRALKTHERVGVADLLRTTRAAFEASGDPTFLAYVFYGDPNLALTR